MATLADDGTNAALRRDRPRNTRKKAEAPVPEPEAPADEPFRVSEHTVDEVKAFAADNPDKVGVLLGAEKRSGEPRSTLIEWLESKKDSDLL